MTGSREMTVFQRPDLGAARSATGTEVKHQQAPYMTLDDS